MKKSFKQYECELSGSLITIRENGMAVKAYEVKPTEAVSYFHTVCEAVEKISLKVN